MAVSQVRYLERHDIALLRQIDRTEELETEYRVEDGKLLAIESNVLVPAWDQTGMGAHSVEQLIAFCDPLLAGGGQLLGVFEGQDVVGMGLIDPALKPGVGWLALLHVSNGQRRRGVGKALWDASSTLASDSGAHAMYVSATPTGSAVSFYLKQGCRLAGPDEIVQELFALEPDDIHLVCAL